MNNGVWHVNELPISEGLYLCLVDDMFEVCIFTPDISEFMKTRRWSDWDAIYEESEETRKDDGWGSAFPDKHGPGFLAIEACCEYGENRYYRVPVVYWTELPEYPKA